MNLDVRYLGARQTIAACFLGMLLSSGCSSKKENGNPANRHFLPGCTIRFVDHRIAAANPMTFISPEEVKVEVTIPETLFSPGLEYRAFNPDGKFFRVIDPY